MLVITARLFKDNQLVGYRLSDGQSVNDLSKQQTWLYAKNKQIMNVTASGTEIDPVLSGTNGFELKSLPQIKWEEKANNNYRFTAQDMLSAKIRLILEGEALYQRDADEILRLCKLILKNDVNK